MGEEEEEEEEDNDEDEEEEEEVEEEEDVWDDQEEDQEEDQEKDQEREEVEEEETEEEIEDDYYDDEPTNYDIPPFIDQNKLGWGGFAEEKLHSIIQKCLERDPRRRIDIFEVVLLLRKAVEINQRLLVSSYEIKSGEDGSGCKDDSDE